MLDYLSCIIFRVFGPLVRALPLPVSLFLGKGIGGCLYYFDFKHRAIAYANIKKALGDKLSPAEISAINKKFYQNFGQNLIEVFLIPIVKKKYFNKYITVEGKAHTTEAFRQGKGVILVAMHAGNWELSNIVCANLGFLFSLFVREQKFARLNKLLNSLRQSQGYKIIQRKNQVRGIVEALKKNEAVGMTVDQGGKSGELVKFFGKDASMATGAVKLALKYGAVILPAYYTRINGPYQKVIIGEPFNINKNAGVKENLQELVFVFEKLILKYPYEYYWPYKIWKYTKEKNVLILSDGKAGHLRQSQAAANIVTSVFSEKDIKTNVDLLNVEFKNKLSRRLLTLSSCLSGKYNCQGCLWCLKKFLEKDNYKSLVSIKPDIVISCGWGLAAVNYIISRDNLAKSIVLMRPSILNTKKFDLIIMPRHDRPPKRKNILITEGALNLIDDNYLQEEADEMKKLIAYSLQPTAFYIGLLIGGDAKKFHLSPDVIHEVARQLKTACEKNNTGILATTSRRTPLNIENSLKEEFKNYPYCESLIIANEENPSFAVGGILGLSRIIVISPESISMISEAVNSKKYVIVFAVRGLDKKHLRFLKYFAQKKYIYLVKPSELAETIEDIKMNNPAINTLKDKYLISEAIKEIV